MIMRCPPLLTPALLLATTLTPALLADAPDVRYESAENGHELAVDGSSNIHDWTAETQLIVGHVELPGQWKISEDQSPELEAQLKLDDAQPGLEVRIPVRSLKSGKDGLDKNMYKAMNASRHPHVTFVLAEARPVDASEPSNGAAVTWHATGELTIAGTTRSIDLTLTVEPMDGDRLKINVEKPLKMTDFKIDPPTAMLGMARAKDDVTVTATWILQRRTPQPTIPQVDAPAGHRKQMTQVLVAYGRAQQALARNDHASARRHLITLRERVDALLQLETDELPASLREAWSTTLDQTSDAARSAAEAETLNGTRVAFASLTAVLGDALAQIGFAHSSPIAAYHHANQRGTAGAVWIHVPLNDEQGNRLPVRSPYGAANRQPEQMMLYMPQPVNDQGEGGAGA